MRRALESGLYEGKDPEQRAMVALQTFLASPKIKAMLKELGQAYWGVNEKDVEAARGVFDRFKRALRDLKEVGNEKHRQFYHISKFHVFYIPIVGEKARVGDDADDRVLSPVKRPTRPEEVKVEDGIGTRTHHMYRAKPRPTTGPINRDRVRMYRRTGSCHCLEACIPGRYSECKTQSLGKWVEIELVKRKLASTIAAATKSRSRKTQGSLNRQTLAKEAKVGQVIALESANDENGFPYWLAVVTRAVFMNTTRGKARHGLKMKKGYYMDVQILDRNPNSSELNPKFKLKEKEIYTVNAEGVVYVDRDLSSS
jgi:hypothetical protein